MHGPDIAPGPNQGLAIVLRGVAAGLRRGAPVAWIRNGRHDILAMNPLARALYAPVLADPRRPANTTRFVYREPERARELFVDYDQVARDAAAMLRLEAGRNPHDRRLIELVGELSTRSELFRQRWASQDVRHRSGRKRLRDELRVSCPMPDRTLG